MRDDGKRGERWKSACRHAAPGDPARLRMRGYYHMLACRGCCARRARGPPKPRVHASGAVRRAGGGPPPVPHPPSLSHSLHPLPPSTHVSE